MMGYKDGCKDVLQGWIANMNAIMNCKGRLQGWATRMGCNDELQGWIARVSGRYAEPKITQAFSGVISSSDLKAKPKIIQAAGKGFSLPPPPFL